MKTAEQILIQYAGEDTFEDGVFINPEMVISAMKQYATEAIKADRERVAKAATIALRVNINGQGHPVVNKESILNLPIELK